MRILCVFGQHNYGDPARGEGVEYTHFLPALRALGHEVFFFDSFSRATYSDFAALNRALLQQVEKTRPDLVFTVLMMAEVWLETIALIRDTGCRVLNWSTDDSWKYAQFSRLIAADFDLWATTCPDAPAWYARDGIGNAVLTQWAASSVALVMPRPARDCGLKVSFIGSAYGSRGARIEVLRRAGIEVECYGHGWPNGPLAAARVAEVVRDSVLSLNFSEAGQGSGRQIKARVFEVPAVGGMLLSEAAPHLADYLQPEHEAALFEGDADLAERARHLLADPARRDAIAAAGHARVAREHTYEARLRALLQRLQPSAAATAIDWAAFEAAASRHRVGPLLRLLRELLVLPCVLLWGRQRGRRAARRALFEISWRLAGRSGYGAGGWPGRLFYAES
jgi:spore maturation protein CgeB